MATENRLLVLHPAPSADNDGTTYGNVIADLSIGYGVLAPSGARRNVPGPCVHVDDLADDDGRRFFYYGGDEARVTDDGRGGPLVALDVNRLCAALGRQTRSRHSDRLTAAHRYLRGLRDDMRDDLTDAVVVATFH